MNSQEILEHLEYIENSIEGGLKGLEMTSQEILEHLECIIENSEGHPKLDMMLLVAKEVRLLVKEHEILLEEHERLLVQAATQLHTTLRKK